MKSAATPRLKGRPRRHMRIRKKVKGTAERPRLTVFRSLNHIYAQLVDDLSGRTILTVSSLDKEVVPKAKSAKGKLEAGKLVGKQLAALAKEKGIERVCFDRGGYLYHGRVKAVAEGAREGGLNF
ncbi:MAG: 50S ribosomal protein L18 [Candidatus Eisenbacteria bacterium]|uniref:Large ribosomal subunit protein uL18 n=1 Tax=Eiseniibacteriota bacterium TaxID=2212470 RepID=A0A538TCM6_UNCEI|nr:MAG: 50S ribosomal protein L18 [Candidatus Eisenbacteria bacterium]TMQ61336.1 MAG: 50S ribosomal protein L18 [Candidatus Eisenbacteria bacterium]